MKKTTGFQLIIALNIFLLLFGCVGQNLGLNPTESADTGIIIIGVEPYAEFFLTLGKTSNETWYFKPGFSDRGNVVPKGGYAVISLSPSTDIQRYGVHSVKNFSPQGGRLYPKIGLKIPTFEVQKNKATYVGHIIFRYNYEGKGSVEIDGDWQPDIAREYIEKNYPNLIPIYETKEMKFLLFGGDSYF